MLIDFQQHYTPPELLKGEPGKLTVDLDRDGNPHYLLNPLLADLGAHVRMMDANGVEFLPPVPTVNCRTPSAASATASGVCGAKRS